MKTLIKNVKSQCLLLVLSTAICVPFKAIAAGDTGSGGGSTGGGDLECDAKIQDIATNIQAWVTNKGERSGIRLDLSSSVHPDTRAGYTFPQYETSMIDLLKKPVDANCVSQGDSAYPVEVGNSAKICKTFVDTKGIHMVCNRELFMGLDADDRIKQVHHELAINVAGLEPDTGPISTYKISKQLSAFIDSVSERRLVVITQKPKEYVQVVTCTTLKGPLVCVYLDPRAADYLHNKANYKGCYGGEESKKFSFSVDFVDDDHMHTELFSKSWLWHGIVPVWTPLQSPMFPNNDGPPVDTRLVQADYEFTSPVQLMKISGTNYVKAATFSVRSKIETYQIKSTVEEDSNNDSSADGDATAQKSLLDERAKYRDGLIDSEISCVLKGIYL